MRKIKYILVAVLFSFASLASADNPNQLSYVVENENEFTRGIVFGLGEGILMASSYSEIVYGRPLICVPETLAFKTYEYYDLLKAFYIRRGREDTNTAAALLFALKESFPCE